MLRLDRLILSQDDFRLAADLTIDAGTMVAILGPSGAGKSTLLAAIAGFVTPASGRILWQGRDITQAPPGARPVSILFQDQNLFPHLTVAENVGLGIRPDLRLSAPDRARVSAALDRTGLSGHDDRLPASLSGGQQSRVALARVLLRARPVMLLDEPFAALGPALKATMLDLVAEIATENVSVKAGHFYTLVGYEVVTAPDNFFYSHAMTMYNSEPFTHTGFVSTVSLTDNVEVYGGWTAGWDTGFEKTNGGSNFLGGFSLTLTENASFIYITTIGNFGDRSGGANGYGHSCVLDISLTEKLNYVFQSDMLRIRDTGEFNIGINQYLLYALSDDFGIGARMEWWQADDVTGFDYGGQTAAPVDTMSYYEFTVGVNAQLTERSRIRPEFRLDWAPALDYSQGIFGIDWITVY